jgi:hypothetical protein
MKTAMKTGFWVLCSAALVLSGCSASSSMSKKERDAAAFQDVAELIESGNYMFTVRSASPSGGRTIQITSLYALRASDGTYSADLPYFGRAYAGGYGNEGGITFSGEPEDLQINRNDSKNIISVDFTIQTEQDRYTVTLNVGPSGYGNLTISCQKRQTISYYGLAGELKD